MLRGIARPALPRAVGGTAAGAGCPAAPRQGALREQRRGYKDGHKGITRGWTSFFSYAKFGGPKWKTQSWMTLDSPPRRPDTYYPIPLSVQKERPFLDPYVFKYVGVQVGPDGRPVLDARRRRREATVRHEFRSLLAERNWHHFPQLHTTRPPPYSIQWQGARRVWGLWY
eukprot:TRINITY_DN55201_c0_g1_i1.p3 TRINITY_DN55201_c0_g1~~TRINITY_DN55201_c0_g1_i1.p3  ORF type:complete len:170 (+),score=36.08 TRINITY_DN55201_c0_g1_i1:86-595(+)